MRLTRQRVASFVSSHDRDTDVATEGEKVEVAVGDGTSPATVAPLSILDPQKRRPRD